MIFSESAKEQFDMSIIDEIPEDDEYLIWKKTTSYGRAYYGVANFCGIGAPAEGIDISWREWDGNEIYICDIENEDVTYMYKKTIGIMKSWQRQLSERFPKKKFVVFASFDDGDLMDDVSPSFTLRFWKVRKGQGPQKDILTCPQPAFWLDVGKTGKRHR